MKVPSYYCPHCDRFKKWRETTYDGYGLACKHCGYRVKETEDVFREFIKEYIKRNEGKNDK